MIEPPCSVAVGGYPNGELPAIGAMTPENLGDSSWPGIAVGTTASLPLAYVPAIHVFLAEIQIDVDARDRRQVYAVCASLTAMPGHDEKRN
jgi:hypothetical protein